LILGSTPGGLGAEAANVAELEAWGGIGDL
jgi:hypothetical protein